MGRKLTDIEKIFFEKNNLNVNDMSFIELMENREKAYNWVFENKKKFKKEIEENKEEFLLFLKEL